MPIHIYPPIESNYDWKVEKVEQGMKEDPPYIMP